MAAGTWQDHRLAVAADEIRLVAAAAAAPDPEPAWPSATTKT